MGWKTLSEREIISRNTVWKR